MCPRAAPAPATLFLAVGALLWSAAGAWELTILHTNDVHSRLEQTSEDSSKCVNASRCMGGVARLFTKVQQIRRAEPNVLLLDAGDQYQGTIWFTVYKGAEVAHFMNALRYDAMALGNHEFDNGVEGLIEPLLKEAKFPILSANIKAKGPLASQISGLYLPYKVLPVGDEVVGIVGYTSKETPFLSNPGTNLVFEDEITALQPEVDKLKTLNVNKIIALGHSGFETDKLIAQKVRGVDVVVGGHSNTFLYTGNPPSKEVPAGKYPFIVTSDDGRKVPVVQAYAFGKYLGYLKIEFDERGNVISSHGNPILLNSSIPEDPSIKADINKWRIKLDNYSTQELGKTIVYLDGSSQSCRFRECNMGNLICDAMINNNLRHADEMFWNHVSMCILNGGGIRSPIDERNNGTITWENLAAVLPFGGTFDLVQLKGSTLKKAFEHSVHRYGQSTGEFLQVGGIHVVYDLSRKPGDRVVKLDVLCTKCRVPSYDPLKMDEIYKVILPNFLANGGDGFQMIKDELLRHDSGDQDINVVSTYISKMKVIYPAVEGRIKFSTGSHCHGSFSLIFLSFCAVIFVLYQ
ncbi:5'-nucleotidase [Rhinopithecus roxellana]|uniref:5'-nucleotidase n=3 Tax=Cercopithecidae TaxID=9527 RepID=A0A2K6LUM2_RHIBE|nr:5'-nucleotidase [Rhinopithecus roxellana]XP_017748451.1 PREDICTED: 5'-nucleotidase [Rhinopithecus bieti]XP_033090403.1 5'-nucleotidase [Trachypithecus francoisi]